MNEIKEMAEKRRVISFRREAYTGALIDPATRLLPLVSSLIFRDGDILFLKPHTWHGAWSTPPPFFFFRLLLRAWARAREEIIRVLMWTVPCM